MISTLLPYTSSFAHSTNVSYNLKLYDAKAQDWGSRMTRSVINTISILAICYSALKLAEEKGKQKAMFYAAILIVVAYMLPRLMMSRFLDRYCKDCPPNGLMSMSIVSLVILLAIEQTIRFLL